MQLASALHIHVKKSGDRSVARPWSRIMNAHQLWLDTIKQRFSADKQMVERAVAQLSDDELRRRPAPQFNSVATIIRHVGGNLRSRWTDFLTTDGEKPDRNREAEFADWTGTRDELMQLWESGFKILWDTVASLQPDDMDKSIAIRNEPHTVPRAIIRSLDHLAYHVGQILFLARLVHSGDWNYITVAPEPRR